MNQFAVALPHAMPSQHSPQLAPSLPYLQGAPPGERKDEDVMPMH